MSTRLRAVGESRPRGSHVAVHDSGRIPAEYARSRAFYGIIAACLLWSFWPTIVDLSAFWATNEDYSVGALVPFVAAFLGWRVVSQGKIRALRPSLGPIAIVFAAQLLRVVALYLGSAFGERVALWITISAMLPLLLGWRLTRALGGVLAFLLLMIPFPMRLHDLVSPKLQALSTLLGQLGLELLGYFVVREGNVLKVDDSSAVLVAEACSGLRMLTAFIFTGAVFACLVDRPRWQRIVLLASTIPIAVVANGIRVLATAIVVHHSGSVAFERNFHDFAGLAMMPVAVLFLFGLLWLMALLNEADANPPASHSRHASAARGVEPNAAPVAMAAGMLRRPAVLTSVACGLLLAGGVAHRSFAARFEQLVGKPAELQRPLATLPLTIGDWVGVDVPLDDSIANQQNFDDEYINRAYRNAKSGAVIQVFVGYVGRPRSRFGHRPDVCFAAHGWDQESRESLSTQTPGGAPVPGTLYIFRKPDELGPPLLVLATYMRNGCYVERHDELRQWNARTPTLPGERPAYLTRVQASLIGGADRAASLEALRDFVGRLAGPVADIMPYWGGKQQ